MNTRESNLFSNGDDFLLFLHANAKRTTHEVKQRLGCLCGRLVIAITDKLGYIPDEVKRHVHATMELRKVIQFRQEEGKTEISGAVVKTLKKSEKFLRQLSNHIHCSEFLEALKFDGNVPYLDRYHFMVPSDLSSKDRKEIPDSHFEWSLHASLLTKVYRRTDDADLKQIIAFLMINYLGKAAPYCFSGLSLPPSVEEKLNQMFHHGLIEPGIAYNRESPIFDPFLNSEIAANIAPASGSVSFIVGTKNIEDLLPVWFSVIQTEEESEKSDFESQWAKQILEIIGPDLEKRGESVLTTYLTPPLLFDFTLLLENFLMTSGDESANDLFEREYHYLKKQLDQAILSAVERLSQSCLFLQQSEGEKQRLAVYLRSNILCICRGEMKGFGFLKILPVFDQLDDFSLPAEGSILNQTREPHTDPQKYSRYLFEMCHREMQGKMEDFVSGTGIRMSYIAGKEALLQSMSLEQLLQANGQELIDYSDSGPNVQFFTDPLQMTKTAIFERLERELNQEELIARHPYLKALGLSTLMLVKGLLEKIDKQKWESLNAHPDSRQVVQTYLFQLLQHLTQADNHLANFGKFTRALELIHYDMSSLLKLFTPYDEKDFSSIYQQQLQVVPDELQGCVTAGLTKSSMNTLAGVQVALRQRFGQPCRVYQQGAHFEIVLSMDRDYSLEGVLADSSIDQVHLYVADFNHNINLNPFHNEYSPGDIKCEVKALLDAKPGIEHLTVAVDCTIDYNDSQRVRELLAHFSKAIHEGRLNFMIFRSGQKFDMLGMDDYYGSPFYMVNNGEAQWQSFDILTNHEAFKTDLLSTQWFCLLYQYAPQAVDDYRKVIFDNTQRILAHVPESLKPGNHSKIKVCTVAEGVDTCFIDIKIMGDHGARDADELSNVLFEKFADNDAKIHTRGGYGFYHPNVTSFPFLTDQNIMGRTLRINPGLSLRETDLIIEFLNDTAKLYENT